MMVLYPFTAPISARPMPWLPLVGSTMVFSPGRIRPCFSAVSIMARAVLVLMDPPAFMASNFTRIWASCGPVIWFRRMRGVCPVASSMLPYIISLVSSSFLSSVYYLMRGGCSLFRKSPKFRKAHSGIVGGRQGLGQARTLARRQYKK